VLVLSQFCLHHLEFLETTAVNGPLENGTVNGDKNSDGNVTPPGEKLPNGAAEKSRPDVILVTGRPENCEAAKEAMLVCFDFDPCYLCN